jgi:hypothetical protein
VDHQPKTTILIALEFDEMVPATESRELDQSFIASYRVHAWMTKRRIRHLGWSHDCLAPISPTRGHSAAESREDSASYSRIFQRGRVNVEANREHAAADVTSYGLRIEQVRRRDDHADADIRSEMNVWHHCYLLDVWRASEALDRFRNVVVYRLGQPSADWSE